MIVAGGYLESLMSSFGGSVEGPDPGRLEGLLELARQRLDQADAQAEVREHMERMRVRIQETLRDRQGNYDGRRSALHADVSACIERNLSACRDIDSALSDYLEAASAEVLDRLQRGIQEFFESSDQLSTLARSAQPLCPGCGSQGPESICPACSVDRLIPDPDFAEEDFEQTLVNEEFMAVFQAYQGVVEGRSPLADLVNALQPLEFSLLEAQALVEQAVADDPDNAEHSSLLNSINQALEGVQRMHSVEQNRLTRELNQGWVQIFRGAKALNQLLPGLQ